MSKILFLFILAAPFLFAASSNGEQAAYPYHDPLQATVFAIEPIEQDFPLKKRKIKRLSSKKLPKLFFYQKHLRYGTALQSKKAPLIFCIAGTGSSYRTMYLRGIAQGFYNAGMHVVLLSSPTHPNFITTCSSTAVPGNPEQDAEDLLKLMKAILVDLGREIEVTNIYLCGYSLGAIHAAFCAKKDAEENIFPFERVLLLNPPVNLYRSMSILDKMLPLQNENAQGVHEFVEETIERLSNRSMPRGGLDFSQQGIKGAFSDASDNPEKLRQIIGFVFRIKTVNMVFCSDVMTRSGLLIPPNQIPGAYDSLLPYYKAGLKIRFSDYMDNLMAPYFIKTGKYKNRWQLIDRVSLQAIEPFLKSNPRIFVVTNRDEIILNQGDLDFLVKTFAGRIKIYPHGGHCGNINFKENVDFAVKVITSGMREE